MKKWHLLVLLLFLLFVYIGYLIYSNNRTSSSRTSVTKSDIPDLNENNNAAERTSAAEEKIKCQNAIVTPEITTELFTYDSGNKIRMDYRMNASTDEQSGNHQAFYDGQWLYIWDRGTNDLTPVDGMKARVGTFALNADTGTLGVVSAFKSGQISGDRMCNVWDDVDPVFEVPKNVTFAEYSDTEKIWQERVEKVCDICGKVPDEEAPSVCQKNLNCK